jgi:hypothetical protein
MTKDKTATERMRRARQRKRDAGLTPGEVWAAPQDWPTIRKLEKELKKLFLKGEKDEKSNHG